MSKSRYLDTFDRLCRIAEIPMEKALSDVLPKIKTDEPLQVNHVLNHIRAGLIPSQAVTEALADYFGTGLDTFLPDEFVIQAGTKIYLAGPITGKPFFMDMFADAQAYLENKGYIVFNPAFVTNAMPKTYMTRRNFMDLGILMVSMCSQIAMLPDWEPHTGCQMEHAYAVANQYEVLHLTKNQIKDGHRIRTGEWNSIPSWDQKGADNEHVSDS